MADFVRIGNHIINADNIAYVETHSTGQQGPVLSLLVVFTGGERLSLTGPEAEYFVRAVKQSTAPAPAQAH